MAVLMVDWLADSMADLTAGRWVEQLALMKVAAKAVWWAVTKVGLKVERLAGNLVESMEIMMVALMELLTVVNSDNWLVSYLVVLTVLNLVVLTVVNSVEVMEMMMVVWTVVL